MTFQISSTVKCCSHGGMTEAQGNPSFGKPIVLYDPHSTGAESYRELAKEVLEHA